MSLIPCSECKNEISDKAASCPHCGAPVVRERTRGAAFVVNERSTQADPATALIFRHPKTKQIVNITQVPSWVLLFGFFYFAVKGIWTHAVASALLAIVTAGISWLVYPFFAKQIVRNHLLITGWEAVGK